MLSKDTDLIYNGSTLFYKGLPVIEGVPRALEGPGFFIRKGNSVYYDNGKIGKQHVRHELNIRDMESYVEYKFNESQGFSIK